MFSHFTLGSNDLARSARFYQGLMKTLGWSLLADARDQHYLMYGPEGGRHPHLFICTPFDGLPATWSNGYHIAFHAGSKETVDQFYHSAMDDGGLDEGEPRLRTHYAEDYYAAYIRDPDGNKLQAVCYINGRQCGPTGDAVSHITIGHGELARDSAFYAACFGALGYEEIPEEGDFETAGFGVPGYALPVVYVQPTFDGRPTTWGNGTHTAFLAPSRISVDDFHRAALDYGGICDGLRG